MSCAVWATKIPGCTCTYAGVAPPVSTVSWPARPPSEGGSGGAGPSSSRRRSSSYVTGCLLNREAQQTYGYATRDCTGVRCTPPPTDPTRHGPASPSTWASSGPRTTPPPRTRTGWPSHEARLALPHPKALLLALSTHTARDRRTRVATTLDNPVGPFPAATPSCDRAKPANGCQNPTGLFSNRLPARHTLPRLPRTQPTVSRSTTSALTRPPFIVAISPTAASAVHATYRHAPPRSHSVHTTSTSSVVCSVDHGHGDNAPAPLR